MKLERGSKNSTMTERIAGALFALFYLSGRFSLVESDPGQLPHETIFYDLRVWILLALVAVALSYNPTRGERLACAQRVSANLAAALAVLLPLYVASSLFWSVDPDFSLGKALEAVTLVIACICMIPFLKAGRGPRVRHGFWVILVATTGLMCLMACVSVDSSRLSVLGGGPNTFGRNMGLLFLGLLYLQRRSSVATAWRWYPLMALSLLMVLLSGSRGALLATMVGGSIYLLIDNRFRARNVLAVGSFGILVFAVMISTELGQRAVDMFESRIVHQTIEQQYMSGREDLYAAAYELGLESPWFGQGLSGFTSILGINYPHNIVLELFCETGIVGVSLLGGLLLAVAAFVIRQRKHCDPAIWGAFGLTLSSAMFSGDFFDSRGILLMAMLGAQEFVKQSPPKSRLQAKLPRSISSSAMAGI